MGQNSKYSVMTINTGKVSPSNADESHNSS